MSSGERYYYTCAEHVDNGEVHCIRDTKEFKTLPTTVDEYRRITHMSLQKANMERIYKHITPVPGITLIPSIINAFSFCTASGESGEDILMKQEFKGKHVVIIDSKK